MMFLIEIETAGAFLALDLYGTSQSPTGLCPCPLMVLRTTAAAAERKIRMKYIMNGVEQRACCIHVPWF